MGKETVQDLARAGDGGGGQFPPFGAPVPSADELPSLPGTGLWGLKVEAKAASSMLKLPTSHHVSTLRTSEVECG